ncbi:MAG: BrnA antitoxin family protein [Oligoflexia bacterium]|nr:BrnA antitoxin family protein [Oligoflexia bacterium]
MAKKKTSIQREKQWEKEDETTTLAPGASWMKRVNVDFPVEMLRKLDHEAKKVGINRQALIKMWLNDRLEALDEKRKAS